MGIIVLGNSHNMLSRIDYARQQFLKDQISLVEFVRRVDVLIETDEADKPAIIDMTPAGFQEPRKDVRDDPGSL